MKVNSASVLSHLNCILRLLIVVVVVVVVGQTDGSISSKMLP